MSQTGTITSSPIYKKLVKLYNNYGLDVAEMEDDELEWLMQKYSTNKELLEKDLKDSEPHRDKFEEYI